MKILKYGPLVRRPEWPKIRMCQNCGSTIELDKVDTKFCFVFSKPEECYLCPACYKYNLLDRSILDQEEYVRFNENLAEQKRRQLELTLDFYKSMPAEYCIKLPKPNRILK